MSTSSTPSRPREPDLAALTAVQREREGAEDSATPVQRVVPWVASFMAHAAMVVLGLLIPWTTARLLGDRRAAPAVIAEFADLTYAPLTTITPDDTVREDLVFEERSRLERRDVSEALSVNRVDPAALAGPSGADEALSGFTPRSGAGEVTFGGLRGSNARHIVYVVDASGSMIAYLPILIDELVRSIDKLNESQSFRVIFFQRNEAVLVPGPGEDPEIATKRRRGTVKLLPATNENKLFVFNWMNLDSRNIRAASQSNPIAAIELALRDMAPPADVVFILSTDITGLGEFEVDQQDLLRMIERLNRTRGGDVRTVLKTIQFIEEDPLGTLRRIAEQNGGADGYRLLSREELGLDR